MKNIIMTSASWRDPKKTTFTILRLLELFPEKGCVDFRDGDMIRITIKSPKSKAIYECVFHANRVATSKRRNSGLGCMYGSLPAGFTIPGVGRHRKVEIIDFVRI